MARKDEAKWKRIVASVKAGGKGGEPGQWSARKAQLATLRYKKSGGTYTGPKTKAQKSLSKWTKEDWGTKSGKPSTQGSKATGERYLPKKVREGLTKEEYEKTSAKKRADTKEGKQVSKQPKKIAEKTSKIKGANMKGVPHYKKDGTEYKGATHKSGKQLMSGKEHTSSSVNLFHKDEIPGPSMQGSWMRKHIKG